MNFDNYNAVRYMAREDFGYSEWEQHNVALSAAIGHFQSVVKDLENTQKAVLDGAIENWSVFQTVRGIFERVHGRQPVKTGDMRRTVGDDGRTAPIPDARPGSEEPPMLANAPGKLYLTVSPTGVVSLWDALELANHAVEDVMCILPLTEEQMADLHRAHAIAKAKAESKEQKA